MLNQVKREIAKGYRRVRKARKERRWKKLKGLGMHIGNRVNLPMSTWIDVPHCNLISIEDNCGFGENCAILTHDALAKEFLRATRLGRVTIKASCHIGMGTIILPGVTIGPRSIVGAGSVITRDIPEGVVAAGNPARVICSLDEYLDKQRANLETSPKFKYSLYDYNNLTADRLAFLLSELEESDGYMTAG